MVTYWQPGNQNHKIMKSINSLKSKTKIIGESFRSKVLGYILAGFGLVAGLAWNDAIKALIDHLFPAGEGSSLTAKFIYALVVTVMVVIVTIILAKVFKTESEEKQS